MKSYNILSKTETILGNEICLIGPNLKNIPLIIGVFHGDEPQGKFLIEEYIKKSSNPKILFIPCLNPDGLKMQTRTNSNYVDLNRNFPTKNWGEDTSSAGNNSADYFGGNTPASEIETRFLIETIEEFSPNMILTLHAPYKIVNYDGPAEKIAQKISKIINYPVQPNIGYPTPGSFGTYAGGEKNIPTITLELDENCLVQDLEPPVSKIFDLVQTVFNNNFS